MQSYFKYAVCWYYSRDTRASTLYSPSGREDPATGHIEKKVMTQGDCERIGGQLPEFYRAGNPQNKTGKLVIIFSQVSDPEFLNMQENIWAQHFQTAVPGSALWYNKSKEDALHTLATEYWAETWRRSHLAASLRDQAVAYGSALINGYSTGMLASASFQPTLPASTAADAIRRTLVSTRTLCAIHHTTRGVVDRHCYTF